MDFAFNNERYIELQKEAILKRASSFHKLYLEVGGKLFDDYHAKRVLPGFDSDAKLQLLLQFKKDAEVIIAVNPQERIIPMHTEHPEEFAKLGIGDELKRRLNSMEGYYLRGKDDNSLYELVKKDEKLMQRISGDKSKDYFVGIRDNSISLIKRSYRRQYADVLNY